MIFVLILLQKTSTEAVTNFGAVLISSWILNNWIADEYRDLCLQPETLYALEII